MCGALATRLPSASKIAQEKSSRSLMLTESSACSAARQPICSAIVHEQVVEHLQQHRVGASVPIGDRDGALGARARSSTWSSGGDLAPSSPARPPWSRCASRDQRRGRRCGRPAAAASRSIERRRAHLRRRRPGIATVSTGGRRRRAVRVRDTGR
jgi:hypothetical protein